MIEGDVLEKKKQAKAAPKPAPKPQAKAEKDPVVWVLADDRPGNVSQALGIAQALEQPFAVKKINYDGLVRLPNIVRGASLLGVTPDSREKIKGPWPQLVIAAGRRAAPIARYIRKQSGGNTKLVQCMWPGWPVSDFDLVVLPAHDSARRHPAIHTTLGAPNGITKERLADEHARWDREFSYLPSPRVAVLIGGGSKHMQFKESDARDLVQRLNLLMHGVKGGLLITTSRRTPEYVTEILRKGLKPHFYMYDLKSGTDNPYLGFLAHADAMVVTGDSVGMCSEACSTGKPVYMYNSGGEAPGKIHMFQRQLFEYGCARPLRGELEQWKYKPLNESHKIAEIIKETLL